MLLHDIVTRNVLAELIRTAVDDAVTSQLKRRAQEPPISTRVVTALEQLNGTEINQYQLKVVAQDFPDRGRGSLEHKSGADFYIGLRVESGGQHSTISKGLLVQAKKAKSDSGDRKSGLTSGELADMASQCTKMLKRTQKGAFVWVYSGIGTTVVPASDVLLHQSAGPENLAGRNVAEHFRDVLDCFSGDEHLVGSGIFNDHVALGSFLEEIAVRRGVALNLSADRKRK